MAEHVFDASVYHHAWDRELEPALTVQPGDVVHFPEGEAGTRAAEPSGRISVPNSCPATSATRCCWPERRSRST